MMIFLNRNDVCFIRNKTCNRIKCNAKKNVIKVVFKYQ